MLSPLLEASLPFRRQELCLSQSPITLRTSPSRVKKSAVHVVVTGVEWGCTLRHGHHSQRESTGINCQAVSLYSIAAMRCRFEAAMACSNSDWRGQKAALVRGRTVVLVLGPKFIHVCHTKLFKWTPFFRTNTGSASVRVLKRQCTVYCGVS
jgi:hypothetical protein